MDTGLSLKLQFNCFFDASVSNKNVAFDPPSHTFLFSHFTFWSDLSYYYFLEEHVMCNNPRRYAHEHTMHNYDMRVEVEPREEKIINKAQSEKEKSKKGCTEIATCTGKKEKNT